MDSIQGLGELNSSIARLTSDLDRSLPDLVMRSAEIVESEIRSRAPVDSGELVASLDAKAARRQASASATVQINRSGPDGTEHYAIFQEFGTSKTPANPFFRPGVAASSAAVQSNLTSGILEVIGRHAD
ncbi:HK97-gp10 family putative phage morphogenesis protein [Undibacterium curvum]|uniref:HK97-gp10 family putative phage morphogenesis protein n=1 Tax=Undibacterium curvum TaxID=2762294 RepID=UPI003D0C835A